MQLRRLTLAASVLTVVAGTAVVVPSVVGAQERPGAASRPLEATCRAEPAEPAAPPTSSTPTSTIPSAAGPGALADTVTVRVPEGRLHLEPARLVVPITRGRDAVEPVLVADLREGRPGWQLGATVVEVLVDGRPADADVSLASSPVVQIVGSRRHIQRHGKQPAEVGRCVPLVTALAGAGTGSYWVTPTVRADLHGAEGDARVVVQLQLR